MIEQCDMIDPQKLKNDIFRHFDQNQCVFPLSVLKGSCLIIGPKYKGLYYVRANRIKKYVLKIERSEKMTTVLMNYTEIYHTNNNLKKTFKKLNYRYWFVEAA